MLCSQERWWLYRSCLAFGGCFTRLDFDDVSCHLCHASARSGMLSTLKRKVSDPPPPPGFLVDTPGLRDDKRSRLADAIATEPKLKSLSASGFETGNILHDLAHDHCRDLTGEHELTHRSTELQITIATMCSGTDVASICCEALNLAFAKVGVKARFFQLFACEKDKAKAEFAMKVNTDSLSCCFEDIADMRQPVAFCWRHNRKCPVPSANGVRTTSSGLRV